MVGEKHYSESILHHPWNPKTPDRKVKTAKTVSSLMLLESVVVLAKEGLVK